MKSDRARRFSIFALLILSAALFFVPSSAFAASYTHTLSFNANAGSSTVTNMPSDIVVTNEQPYTYVTIPSTRPVREGYDFLGWDTSRASGYGYGAPMYLADKSHRIEIDWGTTELYASWQPKHNLRVRLDVELLDSNDHFVETVITWNDDFYPQLKYFDLPCSNEKYHFDTGHIISNADIYAAAQALYRNFNLADSNPPYVLTGWYIHENNSGTGVQRYNLFSTSGTSVMSGRINSDYAIYHIYVKRNTNAIAYTLYVSGSSSFTSSAGTTLNSATGGCVFLFTPPSKAGYELLGYSKTQGATKPDSDYTLAKVAISGSNQHKVTLSKNNPTMTLYPVYKAGISDVKWLDASGGVYASTQVTTGSSVTHPATPPAKAEDAGYTYTFKSWSPSSTTINGPTTFRPIYNKTAKKYTITWKNHDGTTLETDAGVLYGDTPEYNGTTPTKAGDAQHSYTFTGWSPAISAVAGDVTYTAQFSEATNGYTVTWVNHDGTTLETDANVLYGDTPEYNGATPTKAGGAQHSYTFTGWSPAISAVAGDVTYTAQFSETTNGYTVTWVNHDGTTLETDAGVVFGTMPTYDGKDPIRKADAQYTYVFAGWSPEVVSVTSDAAYTALFTATPIAMIDNLPKTGDDSRLALWLALSALSCACALAVVCGKGRARQ